MLKKWLLFIWVTVEFELRVTASVLPFPKVFESILFTVDVMTTLGVHEVVAKLSRVMPLPSVVFLIILSEIVIPLSV